MTFVIINDPIGGLSSTVRCGSNNNAKSAYSTVSGGLQNTSSGKYSTISGGYLNSTTKDYSTIAGGLFNTTTDLFGTIGGGSRNTVQKNYSTISGGFSNTTNGCFSTLVGGRNNIAQSNYSTILGGCNNIANGIGSMVYGFDNVANGINSVVLGGSNIVGNNNDTVYVPYLNISFLQTGSSVNNLGIDITGNVVASELQPDVYITGGTIDYNTGDLTLNNNNSTSVVISGFENTYSTGGTFVSNTLTIENNDGSSFNVTGFTSGGGCGYESVSYMELQDLVTGGTLTQGSYYLINDFQTCYDQPDFNYNGDPITTPETYHVSDIEQLVVFATSEQSFSPFAFSISHPNDKITYDFSFNTTENTGSPAKGRITERIDEFNNRTDYDHRSILFKRYKSYFQDGNINGRIIEMNNGLVTGLNTNFTGNLITGDTIFIMSQIPMMYEVISIDSVSGMTVAGFNYQNFSDPFGFECELMLPSGLEPISGTLYYFNDVGSNEIIDGGDDMYDGGNRIYTDLFSNVPYTHTQMTDPPVNELNQAVFGDFVYDGTVQSGDTYFNLGSTYFTNSYPGLFVMSAYDVEITDFEIDGNLGADGDGQADTYDYTLTFSGIDYSVYCKRVWGAQDPSVNHIYIVDTINNNIIHNIGFSTNDDLDTISNLTGVTQLHYLLFALAGGVKPTNTQIENVVESYLTLIEPTDINITLSNLNSNFTGVTSNLPENNSAYKSLNYKQTNLTGDTESFVEYLTFQTLSDDIINNYIGNYANTYNWDNNSFLLSNNVFYGNLDYVNNTFGNSCFNNTFDDDCTNNIIGNFFYNNTTDDDFDDNLIGNNFHDNYITANFRRNRIGDNFNNNTIINGSFDRNDIGNQFENNVITDGDFENNKIGNVYDNNIINSDFYKNDIDSEYNNNRTYSQFYGNQIGNGYNGNKIYSQFYVNNISELFNNNIIGDQNSIVSSNFYGNKIGNFFESNTITTSFYENEILDYFLSNTSSGDFYKNSVSNDFQNNTLLGIFAYNKIGNNFTTNNIGDGFGYGISTSQGNVIGNYFYNNTIGEYFYNNVVADGFYSNTVVDFFQLNDVRVSIFSTDFSSATHVYGDYNCTLFKNSIPLSRLSYYDGADLLQITNVDA